VAVVACEPRPRRMRRSAPSVAWAWRLPRSSVTIQINGRHPGPRHGRPAARPRPKPV